MADPGHYTAISLQQINAAFITTRPMFLCTEIETPERRKYYHYER